MANGRGTRASRLRFAALYVPPGKRRRGNGGLIDVGHVQEETPQELVAAVAMVEDRGSNSNTDALEKPMSVGEPGGVQAYKEFCGGAAVSERSPNRAEGERMTANGDSEGLGLTVEPEELQVPPPQENFLMEE